MGVDCKSLYGLPLFAGAFRADFGGFGHRLDCSPWKTAHCWEDMLQYTFPGLFTTVSPIILLASCPVLQLWWFVLTPWLSKCEFSSSNCMSLPELSPFSTALLQPLAPNLRLMLDLFAQLCHSIYGVPALQPVSLLSAQITFLSCSFLSHLLPMIIQILSFLRYLSPSLIIILWAIADVSSFAAVSTLHGC